MIHTKNWLVDTGDHTTRCNQKYRIGKEIVCMKARLVYLDYEYLQV